MVPGGLRRRSVPARAERRRQWRRACLLAIVVPSSFLEQTKLASGLFREETLFPFKAAPRVLAETSESEKGHLTHVV